MIKQIPKTETGARTRCIMEKHTYLLTSNPTTGKHTLWRIEANGFEKLSTANSPLEIYDKIEKLEKE